MNYAARHGETDFNKYDIIQGHSPTPLNENGIAQATAARAEIEKIKPVIIYCSTLPRAVQTANIFNANLHVPIIYDKRLVELSRPECFVGKHRSELSPETLSELRTNPKKFGAGAETTEEVFNRVQSFYLNEILAKGQENALIVSHGFAIRMLKYAETHKTFNMDEYNNSPKLKIENTEIITLDNKLFKQTQR